LGAFADDETLAAAPIDRLYPSAQICKSPA